MEMFVKIFISSAIGILLFSTMVVLCSGRVYNKEKHSIMLGYMIMCFVMFCFCCAGLYFMWLI